MPPAASASFAEQLAADEEALSQRQISFGAACRPGVLNSTLNSVRAGVQWTAGGTHEQACSTNNLCYETKVAAATGLELLVVVCSVRLPSTSAVDLSCCPAG